MVHIYYHIYAFKNAFEIVKQQINYIQSSFKIRPKVNIIITTPDRQSRISNSDCSSQIYDWLSKEILPTENDYVIRSFIISENTLPNEWSTLDFIIKDKETFADDDCILYLHTKGVSHELVNNQLDYVPKNEYELHRLNYERNSINWKRTMEYYLIGKNQECIDILRNSDNNTVGVFLNEPMFNCEVYAGNFFWIRGDYAKTLLTNPTEESVNKNDRSTAEFEFINTGINWKPYSIFNIPWKHFGTEQFEKLLKEIKNEN
jgi:hypothetical protein